MIEKSTFDFLKSLKKNNNRDWFDKNRNKYESAKENFEAFVEALIPVLRKENTRLGDLKVKDCIFRIYRDVRFSKNKDPYKTNFGAFFVEGGKKSPKAGFYIQVAPGNSFVAGGSWMPPAPVLKAIRQEIDYNLDDFNKILTRKSFLKLYDGMDDARLKTTPKGYDASNAAIDHLRQTSFTVSAMVDDAAVMNKNFTKTCAGYYKEIMPFLQFLNTAMD